MSTMREHTMIKAVVFDLDGVLVDSEPVWEQVRRGLVAERGGHWAPDAQRRIMGMSTPEWARYLSDDLGVALTPDEVARTVIDRMAARYREHVPLMDGAVGAVSRIAARWPLAVASSAPATLIETVLQSAGLRACFTAVMSTEQVARGKPAPDIYLAVTAELGCAPSACAAVEDSSNGLRSAAAAGLRVIAIPHPQYPPDPDALAQASLVLPSLAGLTADAVAALATTVTSSQLPKARSVRHGADLRPDPAGRPDPLDTRGGDLRGPDHVRLPAAAPLEQPGLRAAAGRLDLPGRAERLPVLPAHLLARPELSAAGLLPRERAAKDVLRMSDSRRQEGPVAEMQYSRREIVALMRRTGYAELADEAERVLPDPIEGDQLVAFAQAHGLNRDDFINEMGGSP
jgi:HAD superfamily hydrolase (TIGR01509 family)